VGPRIYEEFVWPYEKRMVDAIHGMGARVRLHICGNTRPLLATMGRLKCDLVDLDWYSPMDEAREKMGRGQALLGNLDPVRIVKDGTPESVTGAITACHRAAGFPYIVGAGCEIPRGTPPANIMALRDYALSTR
jgi:uroporphyrinogen-III decarboxylase